MLNEKFLMVSASALWIMNYVANRFPEFHVNVQVISHEVEVSIYARSSYLDLLDDVRRAVIANHLAFERTELKHYKREGFSVLAFKWSIVKK